MAHPGYWQPDWCAVKQNAWLNPLDVIIPFPMANSWFAIVGSVEALHVHSSISGPVFCLTSKHEPFEDLNCPSLVNVHFCAVFDVSHAANNTGSELPVATAQNSPFVDVYL